MNEPDTAIDRYRLENILRGVLAAWKPTRSQADRRYRRLIVSAHRHSHSGGDLSDLLSEPWQRQAAEPFRPTQNALEGFTGLGLSQSTEKP